MLSLPFAFAFGAGLAALASPCGAAMLPAYVSFYMGTREEGFERTPIAARVLKALAVGVTATLAFLLLFGGFGLVWAAAGHVLRSVMPYVAITLGAGLAVLGVYMFVTHRSLLVPTIGVNWGTGSRGYVSVFLFGLAYALATLSCTFPIFLAVTVNALTEGGAAGAVAIFLSYGLGMGVGLIGLTLGAAAFKNIVAVAVRRALPYMERVSAVILVFAGSYIVWYWWKNWFVFNAGL